VTLQFTSTTSANMTLPTGRQIVLNRFNFGVSGPTLSAFAPPSAAPAGVLKITGSNIDPSASLSLTLSDSTGYSVSVPLSSATSTSVTAAVPPYFNPTSGAFGSGTVSVKLTQSSNGTSADSNSLAGFTIQAVPAAKGTAGQSTLSLVRANLQEAQKLQTSIKGTAQDTPAVQAAVAKQITDLQKLVTNIQSVVQNGQSFALGVVGGVNITVTPANIADVDSLILATLQSLASPPTGSLAKAGEAGATGCLSAEALAFAQAMQSGASNLDALALALVEAPNTSAACGTVAAFGSAYQIFGGAGGIGVGITGAAGTLSVPASRLPGAALFSTASSNANVALGLNALISPALVAQASAVQNAIGSVTALAQSATNELLAKASGDLATNLADAQTFITTVAPPPTSGVPTNLPTGTYQLSYNICEDFGMGPTCFSGGQPVAFTNADANTFASTLTGYFNSACSSYATGGGYTCSSSATPFNGTSLQVTLTVGVTGASITITYTLTKTG
jgi:hypothetical protein